MFPITERMHLNKKAFSYPFHKPYIPSCLYNTVSVKLQVGKKFELFKIHHQSGNNILGGGEDGNSTFKKLKTLFYVELESFQICLSS